MLINNDVNGLKGNINGLMGSATDVAHNKQLTQDDFIRLLLTQMKMQSPDNPFDSNTMMQQVAQLTSLSASTEMEKTVKNLGANLETSQVLSAAQLIGKKVQIPSGLSPLIAGEGLNSSLILPSDIEHATITIKNKQDQVVKTIELGASSSGLADFSWNGLDTNNNPLPADLYKMSATAVINGETVPVQTTGTFNVRSVALDKTGKGVVLNLDGMDGVNMTEILKII